MSEKFKNLVVGAGFSGAVVAERIATILNESVLVVDRKSHIAGNCYDFFDVNNICVHQYGSHIFHTNSKKVWDYVKNFSDFNDYSHKVLGSIDEHLAPIPFNLNSLHILFEEEIANNLEKKLLEKFDYGTKISVLEFMQSDDEDLHKLANFVYEKIFVNYTKKQWGNACSNIDKSVLSRVPIVIGHDDRYFQDEFQGIPKKGYTSLIENILSHPNIEIRLDTPYSSDLGAFDRIFYTGSIDEFFDYKFGILPYRSVNFEFENLSQEYFQPNAVVNYPNDNDFTRIHEFKYYLGDKSPRTSISREFSEDFVSGKNERYYPIISDENAELYQKYFNETKNFSNLYFLGRLGDYKYYNMDNAILRALELFEEISK